MRVTWAFAFLVYFFFFLCLVWFVLLFHWSSGWISKWAGDRFNVEPEGKWSNFDRTAAIQTSGKVGCIVLFSVCSVHLCSLSLSPWEREGGGRERESGSCPVLRTLRVQFIPLKFYRFPSLFRLSLLLASTNENIVSNLSVYFVYKAFKLHSISMS